MRENPRSPRRRVRLLTGTLAVAALLVRPEPASADVLGGASGVVDDTISTTVDTVEDLTEIVTAGWDDGATTPPTRMSTVADAIGADELWARGIDGRGVGVALIDTGVVPVTGLDRGGQTANGPDLSFDSQTTDLRYLDGFGHGTHMAGIIAGNDGTRDGFRGVAPGARLLNVRVGAHDGAVDVSQVIAAIDWVVQHRNDQGLNIRVLNLSYGTDGAQSPAVDPLAYAVEVAWRHGIVVVVGAGNDGADRPLLNTPATNPFVVAAGASDVRGTASAVDDRVAPFSSRTRSGRTVDLVAPGVSIASLRDPGSTIDREHPSAVVDDRFFRGSGTSQAAAVTSGAVALLLQARPELTPDQVKALLQSTATPLLGADLRAQGAGALDVGRASRATVPLFARQTWTLGTGTGSLERARGTSHVADDGVALVGEQDIMAMPWSGAAWAPLAAAGRAWSDGTWNGRRWTGDCWCDTSWAGASWRLRNWSGTSWAGRTWVGRTWVGRTWVGRTWVDDGWVGTSWTGRTWVGRVWW